MTSLSKIRKNGFTLIELMIVVVILSLLATIVVPKILNKPEQARRAKAKVDIAAIQNALGSRTPASKITTPTDTSPNSPKTPGDETTSTSAPEPPEETTTSNHTDATAPQTATTKTPTSVAGTSKRINTTPT